MRKYDSKNKRNIGIIIGICIIFAVIFSYFLIKEIQVSKIRYELEKSTVLFDIDKNSILLNDIGVIKKKWNKKFYLTYEEEQYNIGTHVIAFNNNDISLYLYGEFYLINKNSEVETTKEETILNNLGITKFYKIADRKYLLVDQNIRTQDEALKTTNYLIVELDKQGNAILYNNSLNVKVFSATKILTSNYVFDIANEKLIYENEEIDLKKILGSTNEYKEEEPKEDKPNTNPDDITGEGGGGTGTGGDGTGTGTNPPTQNPNTGNNNPPVGGNNDPGNNGTGNNTPGNNGQGNTNTPGNNNQGNGDEGDKPDDEIVTDKPEQDAPDTNTGEIIDKSSYTSIIRVIPYTNSISVDYVIYDKLGEYLTTFVEVRSSKGSNTIHLPKNSTNISLTNLSPGTNYELTFKYTHLLDGLVKEEVIDVQNVSTTIPTITLTGTKVTSKKIGYKVSISSYSIEKAKLRLYINGEKHGLETSVSGSNIEGELNILGIQFPSLALVELKLEDIYVSGNKINKTASWSYIAPFVEAPEEDEEETNPDKPAEDENTGGKDENNE